MPENKDQQDVRTWRRFFAFIFDMSVLLVPFEIVWYLFDGEGFIKFISYAYGAPASLLKVLIVMPIMSLITSRFGTTPGKWLMNMRILGEDGLKIGFTQAYKRYVVAFAAGAAAQLTYVRFLAYFFAYRYLVVNGHTLWDTIFHTRVSHGELSRKRVVCFTVIFIAAAIIDSIPFVIELYKFISAGEAGL